MQSGHGGYLSKLRARNRSQTVRSCLQGKERSASRLKATTPAYLARREGPDRTHQDRMHLATEIHCDCPPGIFPGGTERLRTHAKRLVPLPPRDAYARP